MASYSRTMSHPPIFGDLARQAEPYGAVAQLARKLAATDPNDRAKRTNLQRELDHLLQKDMEIDPGDFWGSPEGAYE